MVFLLLRLVQPEVAKLMEVYCNVFLRKQVCLFILRRSGENVLVENSCVNQNIQFVVLYLVLRQVAAVEKTLVTLGFCILYYKACSFW